MPARFKSTNLPHQIGNEIADIFRNLKQQHYQGGIDETDDFNAKEIAAWFLGTRGENAMQLTELLVGAVHKITQGRQTVFPDDPSYVDGKIKASEPYQKASAHVKDAVDQLATLINKYSLPFPSMRYQGQMNWDVTLPAMAGYFVTMLQNPNNVAFQGGPATTYLEIAVARDICKMIGFDTEKSWAHICCDGTVANIEGMWSSRELRFFPLGVNYAVDSDPIYKNIKNIPVRYQGADINLLTMDDWHRLNLSADSILEIPNRIAKALLPEVFTAPDIPEDWKNKLKEKPEEKRESILEGLVWADLTQKYSVNALGIDWFYDDDGYGLKGQKILPPVIIVPSTKHYSWPKAASLLGLGHGTNLTEDELTRFSDKVKNQSFLNVFVDEQGRMKMPLLKEVLEKCKENRKPVLMVVAVQGSTEESAVDQLHDIISHRDKLRGKGFDFNIHADAAWGGYLLSVLRDPFDMPWPSELPLSKNEDQSIKDTGIHLEIKLKEEVKEAMLSICEADSVTIDPHKWGYVPYAAGSLSYRNGKIVNLVTFGAPYIGSDDSMAEGIGESGVEGSKPGAAAAGVFLSHHVIRPNKEGYGKIINQSLLNARMFYIYVAGMKREDDPKKGIEDKFEVVPFNALPDRYDGKPVLDYIRDTFYQDKALMEILSNTGPMDFVNSVGPDQTIVDYIFKVPGNKSLADLQTLSNDIFDEVYPKIKDGRLTPAKETPVFLSMTTFHRSDYGNEFMNGLATRLGLEEPKKADKIPCMRSVVMDPWAVETDSGGKSNFNFFKDIFIPKLRDIVNSCIKNE